MKTTLQIIFVAGLSLSIAACAGKSDAQKSIDHARNALDQAKKDTDETTADAKTLDTLEGTVRDAIAPGGQPGSISLSGGILLSDGTPNSRLNLKSNAGIGWRGNAPAVGPSAVSLHPEISASIVSDLDKLKADRTFINVGCEESAISDSIQHLEPSNSESSSNRSIATLKANVVFICDARLLHGSFILIEAQTVVLHSINFSLVGSTEKMFSLTTSVLVLEGRNSVSAVGVDGDSTLLPGPTISITADHLRGSGTLDLRARGASYRNGQP